MSAKRILPVVTVLALLSLLVTCRMDTAFGPASSAAAELPADKVLDVARSFEGAFEYETLLPVELNLTVELYRQPAVSGALERLAVADQLIVVTLEDSAGQRLYAGSVPNGGTLSTVLTLPAAPGSVVLRLESPGFESREVTIDGMVLYSEINRVMGLLIKGLSAKAVLPDADQDGVPDVYDVDPLDPEVAFEVRSPATGNFTVAFEDLYPVPGDADYNDFVANYWVLEKHKSVKPVEPIEIVEEIMEEVEKEKPLEIGLHVLQGEATATAKIAGYNHKFGIVIDFPGVTVPRVTREYYDAYGIRRMDTKTNVADKAVIWLFENTKYAVGKPAAKFEITFPDGITREMLSISPHDPVLYVLNTGKDIHLIGEDPLQGTAAVGGYMDSNGYPWALLVPDTWKHPAECQYIGKAYPLFDEWRAYKGAKAAYWYLYPASAGDVVGNNPPSKVSSSDSTQLTAGSKVTQEFHLNSVDPDGDSVQFMSSPAPVALQNLFSLDAAKGLVNFASGVPAGDYLFYFWSVDEHGANTIATPFKATFTFAPQTANTPPTASFNDLQVSSAVTPGVNGYYRENGANEDRPKYDRVGSGYYLYILATRDFGFRWVLHGSILPSGSSLGDATYYSSSVTDTAPTGTWTPILGTDTPSVQRYAITGSLSVGGVLTGTYSYSDAENDPQGTSLCQWYRFDTSTATSGGTACAGAGAATLSYTVVATDSGKYLRLQVTPVDAGGDAGSPVLSGAVKIN
jgi:LruC domain-containing protein